MSPEVFIGRAVGVPWRRWCSGWDGMDCFGCIVLWHLEVLGVDLGPVPHTEIAAGFFSARGWVECEEGQGATCFMSWRDGAPTHCGILAGGGMVLHAQEGFPIPEHGSTRLTRLSVLKRSCPDIRFYRYEGACSPS